MNCKQGDLAIIIGVRDPKFNDNLGKIVRCERFFGDTQFGPMWYIIAEGSPLHIFNVVTKEHGFSKDSIHTDANLRPLKGEHNTDDIEKECPTTI